MGNGADKSPADIEREIRQGRKFTPQEALGRLAGPGAMKGGSAVARDKEAEIAIGTWLRANVSDTVGALRVVMERQLIGSTALLNNLDQPLAAVEALCRKVLSSDHLLRDFVREIDVEWGRMMDERPLFEREGSPAHPDDPYTIQSVRKALEAALEALGTNP